MCPTAQNVEFEERQRSFVERMRGHGLEALERGVIVVIPSISFEEAELRKIVGIGYYEERMLFALLWLDNPELRIVYVTSQPVEESIVEYYLSFLDDPAGARARVDMIHLDDERPRALATKLLDHPEGLDRIRDAIGGRDDGYILTFNVTPWERTIAERLEVPLYGPSPELVSLGSKSGSRRVAREAGVPVLPGYEDLFSVAEVGDAISRLQRDVPEIAAVVMKLNNGFSGQGNAIIDLDGLCSPLTDSETVFCADEEQWTSYAAKIAADGAIVEQLARDPGLISPSVQLRVAPGGVVELVSTHDQILGGPDDQVYLGCRFPARAEYRSAIMAHGLRIGEVLAGVGVIGSFGIDFVGRPKGSDYELNAGEINLRLGGTTHPFLMARMATGGRLDPETGDLLARGRRKCYIATDNLKSDRYRAYTPEKVIGVLEERGLAFDRRSHTGATLHLLGALTGFGKLGTVCIADSPEDAKVLYQEVVATLDAGA